MNIRQWLQRAESSLKEVGIASARLDSEILLAHTLKKPRTYLHAHDDQELHSRDREIADARLDLRRDRTPIAYIIGHKDFYGRRFFVTPSTLIPRPESEEALLLLDELIPRTQPLLPEVERLVDVGTGSGILGISAKLEHPELEIHLLDVSQHALTIARKNAEQLRADVQIHKSDLLQQFALKTRYIIANLPYVDREWNDLSPELAHEPDVALYAEKQGLALIYRLLEQAPRTLTDGGYVLIEADPTQHAAIIREAKRNGLRLVKTQAYYVVLQRATDDILRV